MPESATEDRKELALSRRGLFAAIGGFGIPFLVLLYLGLDAGGYDILIRSQMAIIAWWLVLLGLLFGFLPVAGVTRAGWFLCGALLLLAAWCALGALAWSDSAERGIVEVARILSLLGFLALFLTIQGREGARRSIAALGVAVAVIAAIALTDRFEPGLIPFLQSEALPETYPGARLRFPLEYWNGLAAMLAIGLPALLWIGAEGRTRAGRALAAAAVPLVGLALFMTFSRGGVLEAAAMLAVLFALYPKRLLLLASMVAPAIGTALLVFLLAKRPEIRDFLPGEEGLTQGNEMFLYSIAVAAGVGLLRLALDLAVERGAVKIPRAGVRLTNAVGLAAGGVVVAALLAGGLSGFFGGRWDEFRQVETETNTSERIGSLSSSERYFLYDSSLQAFDSEPATGIGPGTFEYWWSREGEGEQFVRDAHSLYLESLAEMGLPGLLFVLVVVLLPLGVGIRLFLRQGPSEQRALLAVVLAGMVAFLVAAGIDWAWELTVLPVSFLLLAAATLGPSSRVSSLQEGIETTASPIPWRWPMRVGGAAVSVAAVGVIALPMVGTGLVRDSQAEVRSGDNKAALETVEKAVAVEPWSASALVQQAQVLDLLGRSREATAAARKATRKEPINWRNWLVLADLLQPRDPVAATAAYRRVIELRARAGQ